MITTPALAVIDLGSNTFHLLIVARDDGKTLFRERIFVSLAEEGIQRIGDAAFARGVDAIKHFAEVLTDYNVATIRAMGTAVLRSATNAPVFIARVLDATGISIEVITGLQEAQYIFNGISTTTDLQVGRHLIMDIGGGSVEFILVENGQIELARSYNIGLGELHNRCQHKHPITPSESQSIKSYASSEIIEVLTAVQSKPCNQLVGASGSFEVLAALCGYPMKSDQAIYLPAAQAKENIHHVLAMTMQDILDHPAIPQSRAQLIVLAMLLIDLVLTASSATTICLSPAAMKEGILSEV